MKAINATLPTTNTENGKWAQNKEQEAVALQRGIAECKAARPRLTKAQREALKAYEFAVRQEDRYLGSVFVTPIGQREYEAKTQAAYMRCKGLGMTYEHGL